mgnify:FL=1
MKKTIFKLIGILFLVSALVCTQIPVLGTRASSNGFMMDGDKLVKYTGTATAVSVPNGVKTIGSDAFVQNSALSSVTFPDSLEVIESSAFSGCSELRRLVIPEGCKTIKNGAFADCNKLEYMGLPSTLSSLGTGVFAGCERLKSVDFVKGNSDFVCDDGILYNSRKTVVYQALAGRENAAYNMPDTVEEIKKYAFWGCDKLKNVDLSSNLKEISDYAFSNASGLSSVSLPYSVRAIRLKAFEDCRNLRDITIPTSVTDIDDTAFDGCQLLNIQAEEGSAGAAFKSTYEATRASHTEYEDTVSDNQGPSVSGNSEEAVIHPDVPYASDVDHYVEWDVDSPGVLGRSKVVAGNAVVLMKSDEAAIHGGELLYASGVSDNDVKNRLTESIVGGDTIGYRAFYKDSALEGITFPSGITTIDAFAFARSGLTDVSIPYGVTTINNAAFYHCDRLQNVDIPLSVTEIGEDAFTYTPWLQNWYQSRDFNDFLIVGDGILLAYKGNASTIDIPDTVKKIGPAVFMNHSEIKQINIPDTVTEVGEDAFYQCTGLTTITGMNGVEKIEDQAFYGCPLKTVRIPDSVKNIGVSAYGGTGQTDSIIFLGTQIPVLSYEEASTRLSAKRNPAFDGIDTAIVNAAVTDASIKDTVLDADYGAFTGVVYQIEDYDQATVKPVISNQIKDNTAVSDNIRLYDKEYRVLDNPKMQYASDTRTVSDNSLQTLLQVDHDVWNKNEVSVSDSNSTVPLSGCHMYLVKSADNGDSIRQAMTEYYGDQEASDYIFFDLSMMDETGHIPIRQLGKNRILVTLSIPEDLQDKELCLVTLDRNKRPEILLGTLDVRDGQQMITFQVSHFSDYALCAAQGELKDKIIEKKSNSSGMSGLDRTPDTGDHLNIRLILIVGLASLGAFFLLLGFTRPCINKKKTK